MFTQYEVATMVQTKRGAAHQRCIEPQRIRRARLLLKGRPNHQKVTKQSPLVLQQIVNLLGKAGRLRLHVLVRLFAKIVLLVSICAAIKQLFYPF
jgi:hypothetical protein